MLMTPLALAIGIAVGLVRGGRIATVLSTPVRWLPLLLGGLALQTFTELFAAPWRLTLFIIGAFSLIVALSQNLHIRGVAIVVFGLTLNLLVVVANRHVPTRLEALIGADRVDSAIDPATISGIGAFGQLETGASQLRFLGDVVPLRLLGQVLSFGDLIVTAGLFVLAMNLVLTKRSDGLSVDDLLGQPEHFEDIDLRATSEALTSEALTSEALTSEALTHE